MSARMTAEALIRATLLDQVAEQLQIIRQTIVEPRFYDDVDADQQRWLTAAALSLGDAAALLRAVSSRDEAAAAGPRASS